MDLGDIHLLVRRVRVVDLVDHMLVQVPLLHPLDLHLLECLHYRILDLEAVEAEAPNLDQVEVVVPVSFLSHIQPKYLKKL